ncbi:tetraspanin-5-like [Corticium candelabrum]|uniref:tetraspanin-5-like n=1 Tax=Corticium candelabrum TaxID=121492 RepID=UPI002E272316|nr:tetraspanin-5-like [Corticium candelabrum]
MGSPDKRDSEVNLWVKYTIFFFNFFFWLAGGALLGIGIWARHEKGIEAFGNLFTDPAALFIFLGCVMFILGFFGCVGALRENVFLLRVFMWSLIVLFVFQVGGSISAFVFRDKVKEEVEDKVEEMMMKYRDDADLANLIDFIQEKFECCGQMGAEDWGQFNKYFNCSSGKSIVELPESCGVPFSCCKTSDERVNTQCGYGLLETPHRIAPSQVIWTRGCVDALIDWAKKNLIAIGVSVLVIAIIEILGIALSGSLITQIGKQAGYI